MFDPRWRGPGLPPAFAPWMWPTVAPVASSGGEAVESPPASNLFLFDEQPRNLPEALRVIGQMAQTWNQLIRDGIIRVSFGPLAVDLTLDESHVTDALNGTPMLEETFEVVPGVGINAAYSEDANRLSLSVTDQVLIGSQFATETIVTTGVTTDAATITVGTLPLAANSACLIDAVVVGQKMDGASAGDPATYLRYGMFYRVGSGAATTFGGIAATHTAELDAGTNATLAASGNSVIVQVTGVAATTINWVSRITARVRSA